MEKREIMALTFKNMALIYNDVGVVCQIIEEKMKNHDFIAMGNKAVTWENSTSIDNPDGWLNSYFARVYLKKRHPKKAIGYCIHLCEYEEENMKKINQQNLIFPMMNVSLLNFEKNISEIWRLRIYNCLWAAGWDCNQREVKGGVLVYNNVDNITTSASAITYFLDLLTLTSEDAINKLVIEPMNEMFIGTEDWVVKANLPVLKIGAGL